MGLRTPSDIPGKKTVSQFAIPGKPCETGRDPESSDYSITLKGPWPPAFAGATREVQLVCFSLFYDTVSKLGVQNDSTGA